MWVEHQYFLDADDVEGASMRLVGLDAEADQRDTERALEQALAVNG